MTTSQRRARIEAKAEEVWYRLVKREIRKKRQTMGGFMLETGEYHGPQVYWFVKKMTGDPARDMDMSDAKIVWANG